MQIRLTIELLTNIQQKGMLLANKIDEVGIQINNTITLALEFKQKRYFHFN